MKDAVGCIVIQPGKQEGAAPTFCMPFTSSSPGRSCLAGALREPCSGRQVEGSRNSSGSEPCAATLPRLRLRVVLAVLSPCAGLSASLRLAVSANGLAGSPAWKASALAAAAGSEVCWWKSPPASAAAVICGFCSKSKSSRLLLPPRVGTKDESCDRRRAMSVALLIVFQRPNRIAFARLEL